MFGNPGMGSAGTQTTVQRPFGGDSPFHLATMPHPSQQRQRQRQRQLHPPPRPTWLVKGCLKKLIGSPSDPARNTTSPPKTKHLNFAPGSRCLETGVAFAEPTRDGQTWRRQMEAKIKQNHQDADRQALWGSAEYRADVMHDPWADQGWEPPLNLSEDTPMEGVSEEMDAQAARWLEEEARLDQQHDVAERNRCAMQEEVRMLSGAEISIGTLPLVRLRLANMMIS